MALGLYYTVDVHAYLRTFIYRTSRVKTLTPLKNNKFGCFLMEH